MKKILKYSVAALLLALALVGCGNYPTTSTGLALPSSASTRANTGIHSWALTRLSNGTGIRGLDERGKTLTSLEGSFNNGTLSLTRRFYDANGQVTAALELKPSAEPVNAAYTSEQALVVSSMSYDLNLSIDPSGGLIEIPGPIKPIKTPCEKATNQLNRALAAYDQANAVIMACRARFGFAPGVCLAELAAFEQAYAALVQASNNYNAACLG